MCHARFVRRHGTIRVLCSSKENQQELLSICPTNLQGCFARPNCEQPRLATCIFFFFFLCYNVNLSRVSAFQTSESVSSVLLISAACASNFNAMPVQGKGTPVSPGHGCWPHCATVLLCYCAGAAQYDIDQGVGEHDGPVGKVE